MRRMIVGLLLSSAVITTPALARQEHWMHGNAVGHGERGLVGRISPEDREAFTDARIAALHAALKLSSDQEKLWPAVEQAIKGLVAQRRDQRREWRETRQQLRDDFPAAIRSIADRQAARADALGRFADAVSPLYATLDEGQERRAGVLMRGSLPHAGMFAAHGRDRYRGGDRHNG